MSDSADGAVPEAGAAGDRPPVANVPAERGRDDVSRRGTDLSAGLEIFKNSAKGSAGQLPPWMERLLVHGSHAALAACLFGFAWAAGSYFYSGHSVVSSLNTPPAQAIAPQVSTERREILHMAENMADDIRSLKASVNDLRVAQNQTAKEAAALDGLKTRLNAVKSETGASIAELTGKVEHLQHEPEAKLSQIIERLDRIEHQIAAPLASSSPGAAPALGAATRKQVQGGRGDAFDPSQHPNAPGAPHPLGSFVPAANPNPAGGRLPPLDPTNGQRNPQLITNWVVRDVYDGIALVESPRGSIEVVPGETIPGAGTVKSIERRGAGWIVITSRGLVDSARDRYEP